MIEISKKLKSQYDQQYSDKTEEWRRIGAIGKMENIIAVTRGMQFNNVIDIGAGDGNILSLLSKSNFCQHYTAVEISDSAIAQLKKKNISGLKQIVQFDGYDLPFEDKAFDLAICSHVIEHVEFPRKLLREIKRVSINQVFEIPIDFSFDVDKKFDHFNAYGHINIYTSALFNFLLLSEGFEIIKYKSALYKKEVVIFQTKKMTIKYIITMIKRIVWKLIPLLMRLKPNTYTVLTR